MVYTLGSWSARHVHRLPMYLHIHVGMHTLRTRTTTRHRKTRSSKPCRVRARIGTYICSRRGLVCRFRTVVKWFVSVRPCPCCPTPPMLRGLGCSMPFGSAGLLRSPPPYTPIRTRRCRRLALTVRKQAGYGYSTPFGSAGCFAPPPYTPTSTTSPLLPLCLGGSSYMYAAHASTTRGPSTRRQ